MAVLRLKGALFLGALAGLAPLAATQRNYTSYSDLDMARAQLALENSRPADCPPCFNCVLPAHKCNQFAPCNNYTGKCDCPEGFGGDDCIDPLCGSLGAGDNQKRPPRLPNEKTCFAAAFPLVVGPLYSNVGVGPGSSIFAGFAVLLVPVPFVFYVFGERIRAANKWSKASVVV
ncbi:hypothetical protein BN1723_007447 [Verticillium longisporum]|uniref:EGF-like domain-containing protein n=1 Tax=Verticillium longisporum TaxID=100787 RepID=A0A0G4NLE3_VERLO|nr:hypothetical protein BN1723_007447 [Verticillium longisporum]